MDAWLVQALATTPHGAHAGHDVREDEGGATVRCQCGVELRFPAPAVKMPQRRRIVVEGGADVP